MFRFILSVFILLFSFNFLFAANESEIKKLINDYKKNVKGAQISIISKTFNTGSNKYNAFILSSYNLNDEDSYYEETAEIVFKSILYYVLFTDGETKTLNRCKEIAKYGINGIDGINKIRDLVANEERANILFKPVEIASEATAKAVFEKLNERLSKI